MYVYLLVAVKFINIFNYFLFVRHLLEHIRSFIASVKLKRPFVIYDYRNFIVNVNLNLCRKYMKKIN